MVDHCLQILPCRAHAIFTNPGRGHRGLLSDGIISLCEVVDALVYLVAGHWLSLWFADRYPLGQAQLLWLQL